METMPPTMTQGRTTSIMTSDSIPEVLIVAQLDDYHALGVARAIERMGGVARIVDNSDFPTKISIKHRQSQSGTVSQMIMKDGSVLELHHLRGVWWRRPQRYKPHEETKHPVLRRFVTDESREAFLGALAASVPNFVNDVGASRRATHKLAQLANASRVGLRVPETLVTNDPSTAREFARSISSGCVYKTFTGCDFGFFETRLLRTEADFEELTKVEGCPLIFQEHIDGDYDIRVTVVGDEVYPAQIHFKEGRHPVDGRVDRVPIKPHSLPEDIRQKILSLVHDYGLVYAAVDLRYSKECGYTFFELNPEGQFLWVEIEAQLKICEALARHLMANNVTCSLNQSLLACADET